MVHLISGIIAVSFRILAVALLEFVEGSALCLFLAILRVKREMSTIASCCETLEYNSSTVRWCTPPAEVSLMVDPARFVTVGPCECAEKFL